MALFYCGLVKMGFSLLLFDFRLTSWHNLPGIFMILAALLVIAAQDTLQPKPRKTAVIVAIAVISTALFTTIEMPFLVRRYLDNRNRAEWVEKYTKQIDELSSLIPEDRIVAVPMFAGVEVVGKRLTFYPSGVFTPPIGIADYVLFPKKVSHIFTGNYDKLYPINSVPDRFLLIQSTLNFQLYQRVSLSEEDSTSRQLFFRLGNLADLIPLPE